MEVNFRTSGDILIAIIRGEVDHHTSNSLRYAIDNAVKTFGSRDLILDFKNVRFMDSSGIGLILGRYKRMTKTPGNLYITGCRRHIERVLKMSDVFSLIKKYDTPDDAISAINDAEQKELGVSNE